MSELPYFRLESLDAHQIDPICHVQLFMLIMKLRTSKECFGEAESVKAVVAVEGCENMVQCVTSDENIKHLIFCKSEP